MDELVLGTLLAVLVIVTIRVFLAYSRGTTIHRAGYGRLCAGLVLLCAVVAVPFAQRFAPFGVIGGSDDSLISMAAIGAALLAGTLLTASGIVFWISTLSGSRASMSSARHSDIVKLVCLSDAHSRLVQLAVESKDLTGLIDDGRDMFMAFVPFDMLSVSVLDPNATMMRRYSITESGNRVSELGISLPIEETFVKHVVQSGTADRQSSLTGIRFRDDEWLSKCGFDSRLSVPVFIDDRVVAVLSFIAIAPEKYNDESVRRASLLTDVLAVSVSELLLREQHIRHADRVENLHRLFTRIVRENQNSEFLQAFPEKVTRLMPMTSCRLSLVDRRLKRLITLQEHNLRSSNGVNGSVGSTVRLEDTPVHACALTKGAVVVVNLDDDSDAISKRELGLMFPNGVRSVVLVPLQFEGEIKGILSLGEMRGWDRRPILKSDVEFAEMLGICGSLALRMADRPAAEMWPGISIPDGFRLKAVLPSEFYSRRLAGPLSSIIGAAELMGRSLPEADSPLMRCVRTIRRNAEMAVKAFNDFREYDNATR